MFFRGKLIGRFIADLVVNQTVIVELKCCEKLISEHQAQLFNYLKVTNLPIGLLINLRRILYRSYRYIVPIVVSE